MRGVDLRRVRLGGGAGGARIARAGRGARRAPCTDQLAVVRRGVAGLRAVRCVDGAVRSDGERTGAGRPHQSHRAHGRRVFGRAGQRVSRRGAGQLGRHRGARGRRRSHAVRSYRVRRLAATGARRSAGGDVHVGHHRRAERRRDHAGQLRVRGQGDGRGGRACNRTIVRSWCCRCSTPTRSTTRSPRRSGPAPAWR